MTPEYIKQLLAQGEGLTCEFKKCADQLGSGMRNLVKYSKLYSGKLPELIEGDVFKTIVPFDGLSMPNHGNGDINGFKHGVDGIDGIDYGTGCGIDAGTDVGMDEKTKKIIDLLLLNPRLRQKELAFETGLSIRTIARALKHLKDSGRIRRIGSDRSGHWEVVK